MTNEEAVQVQATAEAASAPTRFDRRLNIVLALVIATTGGLVLFALLSLPATFSSRNNVDQVARGNELAACRSEAAAIVTDARSALDVAVGTLNVSSATLDVLTNEALHLIVTEGRASTRLPMILEALPAVRATVTDAVDVVDDSTAAMASATEHYQDQLRQSREHPDAFLRACKEQR